MADGSTICCKQIVSNMSMRLGNYEVKDDFYVVNIGGTDDVVLGIQWLRSLGEITFNLQTMELKFMSEGKRVVLRGMSNRGPCIVSLKRMEKLIRHGQVEWAAEYVIMPSDLVEVKGQYPSNIQEIITKRSKVFENLLLERPPDRGSEHIIELEEGAKTGYYHSIPVS